MRSKTESLKTKLLASAFFMLLSTALMADCTYQLFNLSSKKGTRLSEFVDQISEECGYTVLIKDKEAEKILRKRLNKTNLQDLIITEVLDILLKENNLNYELQNRVLKVSYIMTKTYNLDYIISNRGGTSNTKISMASSSKQDQTTGGPGTANASAGESESGLTITATDEFKLWDNIGKEITELTNRPEDTFVASAPIINKEAGLVTISATLNQINRVDAYIKRLERKLKNQVMIDVHIYSVVLNDSKATGIDWSQIFALQNGTLTQDHIFTTNVSEMANGAITEFGGNVPSAKASAVEFTGSVAITDFVKFLQEQGDVRSVSNPKVLTLNNQTAFISVGSQFFYKITQSNNQASAGGTTISQNDIVDSVFAGFLLDITPEISEDGKEITLKVNPSISETITTVDSTVVRTIPPDLSRTQMSSVITAKNGEQIILGGLISSNESNEITKVPLLGDIPLLGALFRSTRYKKSTSELVLVITPRIVEKNKTLSLKELGYKAMTDKQLQDDTFISEYEDMLIEKVVKKEDK